MGKKIVVADDDPAIVDAIRLILEDEGYSVRIVTDGKEISNLHTDLPDLILLDIWMSGRDGREIAQQLKAHAATKNLPIIVISAHRETKKIARAINADGFLLKPFEIEALLRTVKKHLG
ncbi:MAG: response regulator [Candidatus Andersenbacteria bacterium]